VKFNARVVERRVFRIERVLADGTVVNTSMPVTDVPVSVLLEKLSIPGESLVIKRLPND
jgi:hypothetical protein